MRPVADLSNVEQVLVTFLTRHRSYLPTWAHERTFPEASQEPRTDCTMEEFRWISLEGLFDWLNENFTILNGFYQLNDPSAHSNGKLHCLRMRLVRIEVEDGYPVGELAANFYKHPWLAVRLRVDKEGRWLSVFCSARMQSSRPHFALTVEESQLEWHDVRPEPWWKERDRRKKAKKLAAQAGQMPPPS